MDIPKEFLSKEFLSQFKSGEDVDSFLSALHAKVYEQMLEAEMNNHLGYPKTIKSKHGEAIIQVPRDRDGDFEPIVAPKHQS